MLYMLQRSLSLVLVPCSLLIDVMSNEVVYEQREYRARNKECRMMNAVPASTFSVPCSLFIDVMSNELVYEQ